jgi:hypothetical protein
VEYEVCYEPWQRWFLDKAFPTADSGLAVDSRDIAERKHEELLLAEQRHLLKDIATGRAPDSVLMKLTGSISPLGKH